MIVNAHVSGWRRTRRESPVAEVRERPIRRRRGRRHGTADAVWRVCQGLPRQQRAAVVLRFYEDLDYAEIAAVLDLAEPTVRSHVHRALAALRVGCRAGGRAMSDETRLEDEFRAGLQRRADDVDTTVDLLGPATTAVRRGRRRRGCGRRPSAWSPRRS